MPGLWARSDKLHAFSEGKSHTERLAALLEDSDAQPQGLAAAKHALYAAYALSALTQSVWVSEYAVLVDKTTKQVKRLSGSGQLDPYALPPMFSAD